MNNTRQLLPVALFLLCTLLMAVTAKSHGTENNSQQSANGLQVSVVADAVNTFRKTGENTWRQFGDKRQMFDWQEVDKDKTMILLEDKTRGLSAKLDFINHQVLVKNPKLKGYISQLPIVDFARYYDEHNPDVVKAKEIVNKLSDVYRNVSSYADTGLSTSVWFKKGKKTRVAKVPFNTRFIRPDRFRFEYSRKHPSPKVKEMKKSVIHHDGKDTHVWYSYKPKKEREPSLNMAIAGATGVSSGTASTVPTLLMPEKIKGSIFNQSAIMQYKLLEDGSMEGIDYYRIKVSSRKGKLFSSVVWIDKESYLLHRLDTEFVHPGTVSKITQRYYPQINVPIPDNALDFRPPAVTADND